MAVRQKLTLGFRLEALGFDAYLGLVRSMALERASDFGAGLLAALGPLTPAHQTALRNLRLAFPNETEKWRTDVARAMWAGIGRTAGELPHLPKINAYADDGRIEVEGVEVLDRIKASKRGAVFISGHFANWEVMPAAIAQRGVVCHMTYRPANNPIIDARIQAIRQTYGAKLQSGKGVSGGVGLQRGLIRGESVALMNDQKYNEGVAAPLFGHDCMTADGPTRLAMRHNVPLIPFSLKRMAGVRYRVVIHEPLPIATDVPQDQAVRDTVFAINRFMEARIREAPEQWFWVHRRWPKEAWEAAGV
jgi:Kdo2-lipid IVA lauroyltransferase/acyltransferase